ncbi:hypothetical protein FACS1894125_0750 [Actinomycetota bacterium]|nr:hypothetical protein FACS1894125_0750 [Actinomycetota bacterium]
MTDTRKGYNTASDIAGFVANELAQKPFDIDFTIRFMTHEVDRWFKSKFTDEEFKQATVDEWTTGDKRWDALLEAIVLYNFQRANKRDLIPKWCYRTRLDKVFGPREYQYSRYKSGKAEKLLSTPAPFLNKGLLFNYNEMRLL